MVFKGFLEIVIVDTTGGQIELRHLLFLPFFWQWWQVCSWARSDCSKTAGAWDLQVKLHDKEDLLTSSLLSLGIQRHVERDWCLFHRFVRIALRVGTTLASCFGLISQRCESLPQDVISLQLLLVCLALDMRCSTSSRVFLI